MTNAIGAVESKSRIGLRRSSSRNAAATQPSRGRSDGKRTGPATASSGYFPPPESDSTHPARPAISGFAARSKIATARRPPLCSGRCRLRSAVQARSACRLLIAVKAAVARGRSEKELTMTTDRDDLEFSSLHTSSPTDSVLTELQLHGHRPFQDEPDPRPLPEAHAIAGAVADIFDALIATLSD